MNPKITCLGEAHTTFSYEALVKLSEKFRIPTIITKGPGTNYISVKENKDVIPSIITNGGYGVLALETLAESDVTDTVRSIVYLLKKFKRNKECPFVIVGAKRMRIHFALMVRKGTKSFKKIIAHAKGIGACQEKIVRLGYETEEAKNNGEAARLVAEDPAYANHAALAPISAAHHYGLEVLNEAFEEEEAYTTFLLIAPRGDLVVTGKKNRMIAVSLAKKNKSGAMCRMMIPFMKQKVNLILGTSVSIGKANTYGFFFEPEVKRKQLPALRRAAKRFKKKVAGRLIFGPFVVLDA